MWACRCIGPLVKGTPTVLSPLYGDPLYGAQRYGTPFMAPERMVSQCVGNPLVKRQTLGMWSEIILTKSVQI